MQIEVIEGAGHFLPEEAPDAVLEHITRFLAAGTR
jgi:pimeloyl-ACP methyl ester carboxylesterase